MCLRKGWEKIGKESLLHGVFSGGHPSKYEPLPTELNFRQEPVYSRWYDRRQQKDKSEK